jgi:2-polyprenyl-6-methoxyphenol hydroxylase-like FAD-dependent oxidoreductase
LRSSAAAWRVRPQPQCWDAPGIATVLIDPHELHPFDFRVEKLSGDAQLERFFRTGIADSVLRSATHDGENWIARFGYLLDKRPSRQFGISLRISSARSGLKSPTPQSCFTPALPRLRRITGEYGVAGDVRIRPVDLYVSTGYRKAGIVLVGDAFAATCPVTGTGIDKVLTDVPQLCNVHIPNWLATDGMGEDKIASFYDDPVKQACDAWSAAKAYNFRSVSIDHELRWRAQRMARFVVWLGQGMLRRLRQRLGAAGASHAQSSSSSSSSSSLSPSA